MENLNLPILPDLLGNLVNVLSGHYLFFYFCVIQVKNVFSVSDNNSKEMR
jgi:hypothetical protein